MKNKLLFAKAKVLYIANKGKNPICDAAFEGLTSRLTPKAPTWCQMFARIIVESVIKRPMLIPNAGSAREASRRLKGTKWDLGRRVAPKPGDLLYKETGSGGDGHVGIVFWGSIVIQNATDMVSNGDARGVESLASFGDFDRIVRFYDTLKKGVIK